MAKTHQVFSSYFKDQLGAYNLTPPQFGTLAFLWKHDGLNQIQLGNLMRKDRTTISGIIDRLEKENLVVRKSNPDDRRAHLVYLTHEGKKLQGKLEELAARANAQITSGLTPGERDLLRSILKKILRHNAHRQ